MLIIRKAAKADSKRILAILGSLDLYHPVRIPDDFWVADDGGEIVGVSCLADHGEFLFLSSVGVLESRRKNGIAKAILDNIFAAAEKDVYLYTIIPDFFKKFGFQIVNAPERLPPKEGLGCEDCLCDKCVCMQRTRPGPA